LELVLIPEFLTAREQYWFRRLNPFGRNGFNILKVASSALGHPSPNRGKCGKPHTPEARAKISAALLGNTYTLGKKASESTRKKQSITHLGKKQSEEHIRKRAERRRGSIPSPETRAKIGAANKGRKPTPESIEKRRQANIAAGQRRRSGEYDQSS